MRIMFVGPSGIGKTTLAKKVSEKYSIPFVSGSVSDLLPETKELSHNYMLNRNPTCLQNEDWKILNLRHKVLRDLDHFVCDRSYMDSAAYFLLKQSQRLEECEISQFLKACRDAMVQDCDLLFYIPWDEHNLYEFELEDNGKRIMNRFFQVHVSQLMQFAINYTFTRRDNLMDRVQIVQILATSLEDRMRVIEDSIEKFSLGTLCTRNELLP